MTILDTFEFKTGIYVHLHVGLDTNQNCVLETWGVSDEFVEWVGNGLVFILYRGMKREKKGTLFEVKVIGTGKLDWLNVSKWIQVQRIC